jgi:hypothetical protein
MHTLREYAQYLQNVGRPLTLAEFDDDWLPIGPRIRTQLKDAGLAVEFDGKIQLTPPSNSRGEIGEPS